MRAFFLLIAFALAAAHGASFASPLLYSGTVTGAFTDSIRAGTVVNVNGSTTAVDNSASAIVSGAGTSQIGWGDCDATCGPAPRQSVVTFAGESFAGVAPGVVFRLGTLSYLNGTSLTNTLIFGATLTLGAGGGPPALGPAVAQMGIVSTTNGGVSAAADADFLRLDALPLTFHVFEGATAAADLFGFIDGEAQLRISAIGLPPGQGGSGFLVPQPGIMSLLALGLAVLVLARRRKAQGRQLP